MSEKKELKIPVLVNHDAAIPPIGHLRVVEGRLFCEFAKEARVTRERFFEIFSGAGVRLLDLEEPADGVFVIRKGEILEFSLTSAPVLAQKGVIR